LSEADYTYWNRRLDGMSPPLANGQFECGKWRKQERDGAWTGIAVFRDDSGQIRVQIGKGAPQEPSDELFERVFTWAVKNPVEDGAYQHWWDNGAWPDDLPAAATPANAPADPYEFLKLEIENEVAELKAWLAKTKIDGPVTDSKATRWAKRISDLKKQAEAMRVELKRPHDEAGKAVQARFNPLIDLADEAKQLISVACTPYRQQRLREEEAAKAGSVQRGEEITARKSPTGLRTYTSAEITDYPAALAYFAETPKLQQLVQKLCDDLAIAGVPMPFLKIVKQQKAAA